MTYGELKYFVAELLYNRCLTIKAQIIACRE